MKKIVVVALLLIVPALGMAKVHKCKVNGKTVYQQQPCEEENQKQELSPSVKLMGGKRKPSSAQFQELLKKYQKPFERTGNNTADFASAKGLLELASVKAVDCSVELKVYGLQKQCLDFMSYITEGSIYNQAMEYVSKLGDTSPSFVKENDYEIRQMANTMKKVIEVKSMALNSR